MVPAPVSFQFHEWRGVTDWYNGQGNDAMTMIDVASTGHSLPTCPANILSYNTAQDIQL